MWQQQRSLIGLRLVLELEIILYLSCRTNQFTQVQHKRRQVLSINIEHGLYKPTQRKREKEKERLRVRQIQRRNNKKIKRKEKQSVSVCSDVTLFCFFFFSPVFQSIDYRREPIVVAGRLNVLRLISVGSRDVDFDPTSLMLLLVSRLWIALNLFSVGWTWCWWWWWWWWGWWW